MKPVLSFFVPGEPVPKGSGRAVTNRHTGKAHVIQDNRERQKPWASKISYAAAQAMGPLTPFKGAIRLELYFVMPRPKSHFGTGKNADKLKASSPTHHTIKPDLDKLIRCVKDALTREVWLDDSQVVTIGYASKVYGDKPGVSIVVGEI
jgi:crossover junction endodeoxyribonuclease RusA